MNDDSWPYMNGTVWYHPTSYQTVILTYLCCGEPAWCLMAIDAATRGGYAQIPISERSGKDRYTFKELPERLKHWKCNGVWSPGEYSPDNFEAPKTL